jgi:hypothetical protein
MCEKCNDLDQKIERYREMASRVNDQMTTKGIDELVAELIAKKAELHPEQKEQAVSVLSASCLPSKLKQSSIARVQPPCRNKTTHIAH